MFIKYLYKNIQWMTPYFYPPILFFPHQISNNSNSKSATWEFFRNVIIMTDISHMFSALWNCFWNPMILLIFLDVLKDYYFPSSIKKRPQLTLYLPLSKQHLFTLFLPRTLITHVKISTISHIDCTYFWNTTVLFVLFRVILVNLILRTMSRLIAQSLHYLIADIYAS